MAVRWRLADIVGRTGETSDWIRGQVGGELVVAAARTALIVVVSPSYMQSMLLTMVTMISQLGNSSIILIIPKWRMVKFGEPKW